MTAAEALPVIVERIVRQFQPRQIILFGSQARGDARADSDIDVLVVLGTPKYYVVPQEEYTAR